MWSVGAADWNAAAAALAQIPGRLGLLVIADGSARRTVKAPGYIDDRAGPYDESVRVAVSSGDLAALRDLDPDLARQLMAPGWPALQVLAELAGDDRPHATVHYCDAPFGVGYLVATLLFDG
jgi:aromatic ring-opening dioxygenase LigB subunit